MVCRYPQLGMGRLLCGLGHQAGAEVGQQGNRRVIKEQEHSMDGHEESMAPGRDLVGAWAQPPTPELE